jgi:hypothetical protein
MAAGDVIRRALVTAKRIVDTVVGMPEVQHIPVEGRDQHGPLYGDPIIRQAIVEDVGEAVVGEDGVQRQSTTKLTFLEPVSVDLLDKFIVPGDETEHRVAKRGGLAQVDGVPYYAEVWLGRNVR